MGARSEREQSLSIKESRIQQDKEQWHLLIVGEPIAKKGIDENLLWHGFIPQVIAFSYYHFSWTSM